MRVITKAHYNNREVTKMKRLTVSLLILTLLTSFSLARGTGQNTDMPHGNMKGHMHGTGSHAMSSPMMYSMMVHNVIVKADALDLTDAQKKEIDGLNDKYLYPLVQKEADFRVSHMKMMNMMKDPNFDTEALKAAIKSSNDLNKDMADTMVDALAAARKILGPENFKQCMAMDWGMMKSGTMQKSQPAPDKKAQ